jgi:hypothetical protein
MRIHSSGGFVAVVAPVRNTYFGREGNQNVEGTVAGTACLAVPSIRASFTLRRR